MMNKRLTPGQAGVGLDAAREELAHSWNARLCAKNSEGTVSLTRVETVVFCLLLFFSSFAGLPFNSLTGFSGVFSSNGFLLFCLGFVLMVLVHRSEGVRSPLARRFFALTLLLMLISLGMSLYLTPSVGTVFGETPLTTGITTLCWLACHAAAILYICHCYSKIGLGSLDRVFDVMLVFVLAVSLVQAGAVAGIPGFRAIYDVTNVGDWFNLANYRYERLCGPASEPSGMGGVICMLCFPYAASKLISTRRWPYGLALCLLVLVAYFTFSSTVYVSLAFSIAAFVAVVLTARGGRIPKSAIVAAMLACVVVLSVAVVTATSDDLNDNEGYNSVVRIFDKVTDGSNQSTAYRNSTVTNDMKIFPEYPVFGVGEGNQGFFYAQNLDSAVLDSGSVEASNALSGKIGIVNGGSFLPSLISGYGIVGTAAYAAWLVSAIRQARRGRNRMGSYYYMYLMALAGSAPMCWIGIGFSGLPIVFFLVLGMPFLAEGARGIEGSAKR